MNLSNIYSESHVFKIMKPDTKNHPNMISKHQFISYFFDLAQNPDTYDIKAHIEKQVSWQLLLKAINIYNICDINHSEGLQYDEF